MQLCLILQLLFSPVCNFFYDICLIYQGDIHLKPCDPNMLTSLFNFVSVINGMCYFCFTVMDGYVGAIHNLVMTSHSIEDIIRKTHKLTRADKYIFTLYFLPFSLTSLRSINSFPCKISLVTLLEYLLLITRGITLPQEVKRICWYIHRLYTKELIQMCNSFI